MQTAQMGCRDECVPSHSYLPVPSSLARDKPHYQLGVHRYFRHRTQLHVFLFFTQMQSGTLLFPLIYHGDGSLPVPLELPCFLRCVFCVWYTDNCPFPMGFRVFPVSYNYKAHKSSCASVGGFLEAALHFQFDRFDHPALILLSLSTPFQYTLMGWLGW